MFVYSQALIQFSMKIKKAIKAILHKEMRIQCTNERFYDPRGHFSYPIKVVIYNHRSMLGYFDADFYELGFHEALIHVKEEQLLDVIRHELAHYLLFISGGHREAPHGVEFKTYCQQFGWGESVYRASMSLDLSHLHGTQEESHILRKVKKLMALAASSHQHESEQATIKSQQLLLKHNLESSALHKIEHEKICMQRIMKQKKENAKMRAIASILQTFLVSIVFYRGSQFTCLEVIGEQVNVEIAEYVAHILEIELERLWNQAKERANLQGTIAKNSFFIGVAKGYCEKIQALKRHYTSDISKGLLVLEKKLIEARDMVHPRLSSKTSSRRYCANSAELGEKAGKTLNINPAIQKTKGSILNLVFKP